MLGLGPQHAELLLLELDFLPSLATLISMMLSHRFNLAQILAHMQSLHPLLLWSMIVQQRPTVCLQYAFFRRVGSDSLLPIFAHSRPPCLSLILQPRPLATLVQGYTQLKAKASSSSPCQKSCMGYYFLVLDALPNFQDWRKSSFHRETSLSHLGLFV